MRILFWCTFWCSILLQIYWVSLPREIQILEGHWSTKIRIKTKFASVKKTQWFFFWMMLFYFWIFFPIIMLLKVAAFLYSDTLTAHCPSEFMDVHKKFANKYSKRNDVVFVGMEWSHKQKTFIHLCCRKNIFLTHFQDFNVFLDAEFSFWGGFWWLFDKNWKFDWIWISVILRSIVFEARSKSKRNSNCAGTETDFKMELCIKNCIKTFDSQWQWFEFDDFWISFSRRLCPMRFS